MPRYLFPAMNIDLEDQRYKEPKPPEDLKAMRKRADAVIGLLPKYLSGKYRKRFERALAKSDLAEAQDVINVVTRLHNRNR